MYFEKEAWLTKYVPVFLEENVGHFQKLLMTN
jgi:hypothetical protein